MGDISSASSLSLKWNVFCHRQAPGYGTFQGERGDEDRHRKPHAGNVSIVLAAGKGGLTRTAARIPMIALNSKKEGLALKGSGMQRCI